MKTFQKILTFALVLTAFVWTNFALAAPTPERGIPITLAQPDSVKIEAHAFGDEFYKRIENNAGYTVVSQDGTWFYATLDANGAFTSTGTRADCAAPAGLKKHIQESRSVRDEKEAETYALLMRNSTVPQDLLKAKIERLIEIKADAEVIRKAKATYEQTYGELTLPPTGGISAFTQTGVTKLTGEKQGVVLVVDFSDDRGIIPIENIHRFFNASNYKEYDNAGSVYDYFHKQSSGLLKLNQYVSPVYIQLDNTKKYYDDYLTTSKSTMHGAAKLAIDAVAKFNALYPNETLAGTNIDQYGNILSFGIFYAGGTGTYNLWSQQTSISGSAQPVFTGSGLKVNRLFVVPMSNSPSIGTFCHENAHAFCGFKDLYDYGNRGKDNINFKSFGLGCHCLMSTGNTLGGEKTPAPICGYLKTLVGWTTPIDITTATTHITLSVADSTLYRYYKPGSTTEYFLFENRYAASADDDPYTFALGSTGVAIWHIDEAVPTWNERESMTEDLHFEASLEQADGLFELERKFFTENIDFSNDYFNGANDRKNFNTRTIPASTWWDGTASNLAVTNISPTGPTVTADVAFTNVTTAPLFSQSSTLFDGSITIALDCATPGAQIYYTTDGTDPSPASMEYTAPLTFSRNTTLKAIAQAPGRDVSAMVTNNYFTTDVINIISPVGDYTITTDLILSFTCTEPLDLKIEVWQDANYIELEKTYTVSNTAITHNVSLGNFNDYGTDASFTETFVKVYAQNDEKIQKISYFRLGKSQTIILNDPDSKIIHLAPNETYQINAQKGVGSNTTAISYSVNETEYASVTNTGLVTAKYPGVTTIKVSRPNEEPYLSTEEQITLYVSGTPREIQTITIHPKTEYYLGIGMSTKIYAHASSGLPLTYSTIYEGISVNSEGLVSANADLNYGPVYIKITQAGNDSFRPVTLNYGMHKYMIPTPTYHESSFSGVILQWYHPLLTNNKYYILRSTHPEGDYEVIYDKYISTSSDPFTDTTAVPGRTYYYKLRPKE